MKKMNEMIFSIAVLSVILVSCKKDSNFMDYSVINKQKLEIKIALELSEAYNDTLKQVFDTVISTHLNPNCIKYDGLYHQGDSMFNIHYFKFGDEMYKYGLMMEYYSPSNGMMNEGMMGSKTLDMRHLQEDTAIVNVFYRNMHQLRENHQSYHNGIYN